MTYTVKFISVKKESGQVIADKSGWFVVDARGLKIHQTPFKTRPEALDKYGLEELG